MRACVRACVCSCLSSALGFQVASKSSGGAVSFQGAIGANLLLGPLIDFLLNNLLNSCEGKGTEGGVEGHLLNRVTAVSSLCTGGLCIEKNGVLHAGELFRCCSARSVNPPYNCVHVKPPYCSEPTVSVPHAMDVTDHSFSTDE